MISLVTPAGRLDRRAVMIEAHRQFRLMRRYGWSFGRSLSFAWAKARATVAQTPNPSILRKTTKTCARESPRLFFEQANGCTTRRQRRPDPGCMGAPF
jgi:hypothetical protein